MLHHDLLLIFFLLIAMALLYMLSRKLNISYPILLVIGGLIISFIPGTPPVSLDPQVVFLLLLPPILFEAAWNTSWYDFWKWRRPISMQGFGLVIFTSLAIALVAEAYIPGFTLATGFLLGGIVSPPDAVSATSVLKEVHLPRRSLVVLEGESLVNDASSLIVFRFALASIFTGTFVLSEAVGDFFIVSGMGIVTGVTIAHFFYLIHRFLPTNASIDTALSLMAPYVMYMTAERYEFSGVLAVVSGGLFLSFRSHDFLPYHSRLQMRSVWETLVFLINGFVFVLIGLQLPFIVAGLGDYSLKEAIGYGLLISLVAILVRLIWIYPATYLPRLLSRRIRSREVDPGWKSVFVVSWAGMRGVVSLAAALSVPLVLGDGTAFPHRNLILFITFIVILVTLVFQGLTLPLLIRMLDVREMEPGRTAQEQELELNLRMTRLSLNHLNKKYGSRMNDYPRLQRMKEDMEMLIRRIEASELPERTTEHLNAKNFLKNISLELVHLKRKELAKVKRERLYDDEILRSYEAGLDYDEAKANN